MPLDLGICLGITLRGSLLTLHELTQPSHLKPQAHPFTDRPRPLRHIMKGRLWTRTETKVILAGGGGKGRRKGEGDGKEVWHIAPTNLAAYLLGRVAHKDGAGLVRGAHLAALTLQARGKTPGGHLSVFVLFCQARGASGGSGSATRRLSLPLANTRYIPLMCHFSRPAFGSMFPQVLRCNSRRAAQARAVPGAACKPPAARPPAPPAAPGRSGSL